MGEIRFVGPGKTHGYPYLVCKKISIDIREVSRELEIHVHVQSTIVISKSKEPSETVRDIQTLTYQNCRIEIKYR